MRKWEYLHIDVGFQLENPNINRLRSNGDVAFDSKHQKQSLNLYDYLGKLGTEGWELVAALRSHYYQYDNTYIFKRPIE